MSACSAFSRRCRPARRLAPLALLLGVWASSAPALAGPGAGQERLTPEQAAKIFPERRSLAVQDRRARIAILQRGERCISGAANSDALSRCMREERGAMMRQRQEFFGAMRTLYQRNGLPAPEWKSRKNRGNWGAGQEGGGGSI
ncbi:hypothetical protein NZK32_01450 [Cyanobium sp. FGCU-52]|nr:hypothetical protein [Cyanobium sp. FGCU52]